MEGEQQQPSYDLQSKVATSIKKQIQFYFSDSNYPKDKFLRTTESQNNGYIPISVLLTFNKVKSATTDLGFLVAIIKTIDELEVKDDTLVKRKNPLPQEDTTDKRTIVVINIPVGSELDSIEALERTLSNLGTVKCVRLPKGREAKKGNESTEGAAMVTEATGAETTATGEEKKKFVPKRHAFVEFSTEEEAQKVVGLKECEYNGIKLAFKSREEFFEFKNKKAKEKEKQANKNNNKDNKKRKAEGDLPEDEAQSTPAPEPVPETLTMLPGTIIEVKNVPELPYPEFKAHFAKFGRVRYVEHTNIPEKIATVRFYDAEGAKVALEEIKEKKMTIDGQVIEARLLEGEEEEKYWKDNILSKVNLKEVRGGKGGGRGRGGRGRGRGGRGRGGGRGGGRGKRQKTGDE